MAVPLSSAQPKQQLRGCPGAREEPREPPAEGPRWLRSFEQGLREEDTGQQYGLELLHSGLVTSSAAAHTVHFYRVFLNLLVNMCSVTMIIYIIGVFNYVHLCTAPQPTVTCRGRGG